MSNSSQTQNNEVINLSHGGGTSRMQTLLRKTVFPVLGNEDLFDMEDAAKVEVPEGSVALTTDSFTVKPLFFPGGDIGKLSICGTVNDLAMRGAKPLFMTLALVLEEGLSFNKLEKALESVGKWAREAGVKIVSGDTKVVERGFADGMYINTTGVGVIFEGKEVSIRGAKEGDVLIINGFVGDHGMAVMNARESIFSDANLSSDCAPLWGLVDTMQDAACLHALRDPTRGGLGAALKEMAQASGCHLEIWEEDIPVRAPVEAACEMLGLDPLFVANEGKLLCAVAPLDADTVLCAMRSHPYGKEARIIGEVVSGKPGEVTVRTSMGTRRPLRMPSGEQLPRIC
ncbi:MAG: hydrogenase expression/formation protein HypE [Actinomycetota bacterium]|nr:hydrogenase expression/formation protein HypE [Actinomycetota bacterium]